MAQTIIAYYCFNDNDATLVRDFTTNKRHSTAETGFSISTEAGEIGKVGVFDGTTTVLNFGNITAFDAITGFAVVARFKTDAIGARQVIEMRQGHHILEITAAGKIKLSVYDAAATLYTVTSTPSVVAATWYTVIAMWNGTITSIYINSVDSPTTAAAVAADLDTNTNPLYIGATNTPGDYFDGMMKMVSFYSRSLEDVEILTLLENVSGIKYLAGDGKIQTGDIILSNSGGREVCTWYEEFDEALFDDEEEMLFDDGELIIWEN